MMPSTWGKNTEPFQDGWGLGPTASITGRIVPMTQPCQVTSRSCCAAAFKDA